MQELRRIRNERGWSQRRLAAEAGIDQATLNQIERGRRSPNIVTLEKLAGALGVGVGDFFPKAQPELWAPSSGARVLDSWGDQGPEPSGGLMPHPARVYATLRAVEDGEKSAEEALRELMPGAAV